jgi:hypothetical protein
MEIEALKVLSAGGDVATIVVMWMLYRLDRRLLLVEVALWPERNSRNGKA